MNKNEIVYWVTLASMPTIWTRRKMEIFIECFNRGISIIDLFEDSSLWPQLGMNEKEQLIFSNAKLELPNNSFLIEDLLSQGYDIIPVTSDEYPTLLKLNLKVNAPLVIYTKGNKQLLNQPTIAIVGSRNANDISLSFTDKIAKKTASERGVIVSGFAKGVDRQALDSAISAEGSSIIVLPQGICTFASGFKQYFKYISQGKVLVMSTFYPKAPWSVAFAMARNPIIYALAKSIYVAQSDEKGGTWSGVVDGLNKQRPIFVRYPQPNEKNANLLLIQKGAKAVDQKGKLLSLSKEDSMLPEEKTIKKIKSLLLSGGAYSSKEIILRLGLNWSDNKMRKALRSIKEIQELKVGRVLKFSIVQEPSLFSL